MEFQNTWEAVLKPGKATQYFDVHRGRPFEADTSEYSPTNAWWLAEISRLIYREDNDEIGPLASPPTRAEILAEVGLRESAFLSRPLAQCAVIQSAAKANSFSVLVFRGTHDLQNWLTSFDAEKVRWSGAAEVHAGFKEAIEAVWPEIIEGLQLTKDAIFYTGHSLGAALATLAAARKRPRALYTFGSPRVGNRRFLDALRGTPVHRVVNNRDIVPGVPPSAMGYHHVGELHYIAHNGAVLHNPSDQTVAADLLEEDSTLGTANILEGLFRHLQNAPESLADHAPVNYVAHLERAITGA